MMETVMGVVDVSNVGAQLRHRINHLELLVRRTGIGHIHTTVTQAQRF